jgi:hypothetical protein
MALVERIGLAKRSGKGNRYVVVAGQVADIPADKLPTLWRSALGDLSRVYGGVCAYFGMIIHPSTAVRTVDHFLPKSTNQGLAYEWGNFRLACLPANRLKGDYRDVIDPFIVQDEWFAVNLLSGKIRVAPAAPHALVPLLKTTIDRLKLNDPNRLGTRSGAFSTYLQYAQVGVVAERLAWSDLELDVPVVARAVMLQGMRLV